MYKIHRRNHDFQIAYFLAGSCHTPDGAYAMLQGLKEERVAALNEYDVSLLRIKRKKIKAKNLMLGTEIDKLKAQEIELSLEQNIKTSKVLFEAAKDELKFIEKCIKIVNPLRKYKHLPDSEAYEQGQKEEWKYELIRRAENSILTTGMIPTDHYATMRLHPSFKTEIMPRIDEVVELVKKGNDNDIYKILEPQFNITKLLNL